jgi:hypothetical protein
MTLEGTRGRENSLELETGNHVGVFTIPIGIMLAGIKWGKTGSSYDGPYFDGVLSWEHGMVYGIG